MRQRQFCDFSVRRLRFYRDTCAYYFFRWIRRWFEVEDRVLYCYDAQDQDGSKVKRAAVLYQASVKVNH